MKVLMNKRIISLGLSLTLLLALSVACMPERDPNARQKNEDGTSQEVSNDKDTNSTEVSQSEESTSKSSDSSNEDPVVPVETMVLETSSISEKIYTYGYLETKESYFVTPNSGGIVDMILVNTGDYVTAGDILYQLEGDDLQLSQDRDMLQQNSSITSAKGNMDSLELSLVQSESDVNSRLLSLNTAQESYDSTLALFQNDIVSQTELDASKNALDQAQISYDQALLGLDSTKLSYDSAKNSYNEALQNYNLTQQDYNDRESDLYVVAPISGLIIDMNVQEDMMNSGSLGVTIVNDTAMLLNVNIMEKYIYDIEEGQSVELVLEYEDKKIIGTVSNISLTGQNGYYPVEITLDNTDKSLVAGMFTEGYINTNTKSNVLKVEKTSLVQDINGNNYIYVVEDESEKVVKVPVKTGIEEDEYVEITGLINQGDNIVVIGQDYIDEGQLVRVVN